MKMTFTTMGRYALKALNWISFLTFVGFAAGMITTHGDKAHGLGDFLAPIIVAGLFLIALIWLSTKGQQALSQKHER